MATIRDEDEDHVSAVEPNEGAEVELDGEQEEAPAEPVVDVVEDDGQDERVASQDEPGDDDGDSRQRRHKESAAERRARAKLAKERDKKELDFQRRELSRQDALIKELQKGQIVTRVTDLDSRIATANNEAEQYDRIFGAAITAKNGEDARAAAKIRDDARARAWQLDQERQQLVQHAQKPAPAGAPVYQGLAEEFMEANPWYDHSGRDADSRIVKEIDAEVAKEYIPTSPAYWKELQRRVQKNLPHHFQSNNDDDGDADAQPTQRQRKGPPTGGSSRSNSSTSSTQIRLSPERVAAMKEAGVWDDPVLRSKMAKAYANYDKNPPQG